MAKVGSVLPLQKEIVVTGSAVAAKAAVMLDLKARADMLRESATNKGHAPNERNALLVAARVLEVAIDDYEYNLICE